MIEPQYPAGKGAVRQWTEAERLAFEVEVGKVRVGPEAAREIALRIEREHGFWDYGKTA